MWPKIMCIVLAVPGSAGNKGEAVSLVCVDELKLLTGIEKLIQREIPKEVIKNYAPDPTIKAGTIKNCFALRLLLQTSPSYRLT